MNKIDLAYLAGLIDGEGYIGIKKCKPVKGHRTTTSYHARIQVRMINEAAIKFLAEILGGKYYREKRHCNNGRPLFCWQVSDALAQKSLKALLPFLRVKKKQAILVLMFRGLQSESSKHRTKTTGTRKLQHWAGKILTVRNLSLSDEYVAECEGFWRQAKVLNGW